MKIKFLTLNIWNGELIHNVVSFLKQEDADVVFLQEVYNSTNPSHEGKYRSLQIISDTLKYPYTLFSPSCLCVYGDVRVDRGNVILSKFPLDKINDVFLVSHYKEIENEIKLADWRNVPRVLQHAQTNVHGKKVDLFNIHGVWDVHGNDSPARDHMSTVLLEKLVGKDLIILAGDFNTRPTTRAMKAVSDKYTDIFHNELHSTFNMKHKTNPGYADSIVDMIFVSPDIKITNHYMPNVDVSDHMPLLAELEI